MGPIPLRLNFPHISNLHEGIVPHETLIVVVVQSAEYVHVHVWQYGMCGSTERGQVISVLRTAKEKGNKGDRYSVESGAWDWKKKEHCVHGGEAGWALAALAALAGLSITTSKRPAAE